MCVCVNADWHAPAVIWPSHRICFAYFVEGALESADRDEDSVMSRAEMASLASGLGVPLGDEELDDCMCAPRAAQRLSLALFDF